MIGSKLRHPEILRSMVFVASYWLWLFLAHLVGLSLVTYGMMGSRPQFNEIADLYFTNYWTIQGWAALLFLLVNIGLSVGRSTSWPEFHWPHLRGRTLPLVGKTLLACGLWILVTSWLTPSQFLGPGSSWEEGFWPLLSYFSRAVAWMGWAVSEEFVFRKVLLERMRRHFKDAAAIAAVTLLWILTRSWHQNLGVNQTLTLVLVGTALGLAACRGHSYLNGAAILGTAAMFFQVLFSLPVLGQDFTGVWIIKYRAEDLLQLVSGGPGGPLSSSFVQLALASWIIFKLDWKIVWTPKPRRLR